MPKTTAQDIKALGFVAELYGSKIKPDSAVVGTDGKMYSCILAHTSGDTTKPITGASWETYWLQDDLAPGVAWVTATAYQAPFKAFIDGIIAEQYAELRERISAAVYDLAANATYVAKAEKCLVAAEMINRRINGMIGAASVGQDRLDTDAVRRQMKDYLEKAEEWIGKLVQGVTTDPESDLASGAMISSHFD